MRPFLITFFACSSLFIAGIFGTCSMSVEELDAARRETVVAIQESPNLNCLEFETFLTNHLETYAKWYNPGVGVFSGHVGIREYYYLVQEGVPGVCGSIIGQVGALVTTPIPTSVEQVSDNAYAGSWGVDGFFAGTPGAWSVESYGHYFTGYYNFSECSAKANYFVTNDEDYELLYVGDKLGGAQQLDGITWCGIMAGAQGKYWGEVGTDPALVTGFNFSDTNGFVDCLIYHAGLMFKGDVCGTNLVDHTPGCFLRHILTSFAPGGSATHSKHWAKASHGNTKCIDRCVDVVTTCHANADPIPGNRVLRDEGKFEYFCQCPIGYKGDGVTACDPVTCTSDTDCKPSKASYCDSNDGLCKPDVSFTWNRVTGEAECSEGRDAWYNISTARFDCIRADRCWDTRECPQQPSRVSCQYPGNLANPVGVCQCNAGYEGGFDIPCTCPTGKTETNVSPGFKVCLAPGECTMDGHCTGGQTCSSGNVNEVGLCQ